ncbi:Hydrolase 4 domain-containing protein [Citrus sinensis]|uniref:Hydrolase 4 domain-containing protein n=1 Tax=Citrus sinensis TaxID=2711 RepID=A0ACB8L3I6_CITSI|nr:Hydrolase 4 domain-containing protein [Citrus sinensis]
MGRGWGFHLIPVPSPNKKLGKKFSSSPLRIKNWDFTENSRGLKLFTCRWLPINQEPKALIFICHGYAMECSITMDSTATRLVNVGYAVYGMDCEGHGKSDGLQAYIENFQNLVDDYDNHFTSICERGENKGKMRFLLGESMGGAMALLLHRKKPDYWSGAILAAPMCKIANDMKPHPVMISILSTLCKWLPKWKAIKGQDIIEIAFKEAAVREQVRANKYCYKGPPRMKTGYELFRISLDLEKRLQEVSLPFLVLHGEQDKVTDQSASKELFEVASSKDKDLKLYPGMWHGLLYGEPLENINIVFRDIINWLDKRVSSGNSEM